MSGNDKTNILGPEQQLSGRCIADLGEEILSNVGRSQAAINYSVSVGCSNSEWYRRRWQQENVFQETENIVKVKGGRRDQEQACFRFEPNKRATLLCKIP
jgi:hypothetical protein